MGAENCHTRKGGDFEVALPSPSPCLSVATVKFFKRIILEVTVELLGDNLEDVVGSETHDFNYELKNGSWVFSSFPEVR